MKSERNNPLETMALFALVSLAAGLIFKFKYSVHLSSLFLIIGLFIKPLAQLISDLWLKWGELMGEVVNRLILGFVYFLVLTPMAFLYRLTKKENSFFVRGSNKESYFVSRDHKYTKKDLMRPW